MMYYTAWNATRLLKQIYCLERYASFKKQIKTKKTNKNTKRIFNFRISIFNFQFT